VSQQPWGAPPPERRRVYRLGVALWLLAIGGTFLGLWVLSLYFPDRARFSDPYLWQTMTVLAALSSGLLFARTLKPKQVLRNILTWLAVAAVLMIGFTYQEELTRMFQRLRSDLIPGYAVETAAGEMTIAESEGGHYLVHGAANGAPVRFLVDTGASDIVLTPSDAKRAGIDLDALTFDRSYGTANGVGYGARARLASLTVGGVKLSNVDVSVNRAEMSSSLLGMTFLRRLKSYGFGDRKLVLRW
jgi:aspartyl protease family protein